MKAFRCSSSISNFRKKLLVRILTEEWHWLKSRHKQTVFFGAYHVGDYVRILWHRGERRIFWCGGDILNIQKSIFWRFIIPKIPATHICENEVEAKALYEIGIRASISPMIFDAFNDKIGFKPSRNPHVYLCAQPQREKEYGVGLIEMIACMFPEITFHIYGVGGVNQKNVIFHGKVPTEKFDKEIRQYQCGLRLNEFDGFSEVTAKSILLGQYPITKIKYPKIDHAKDNESLIKLLRNLKNKKKPNKEARIYWIKQLEKSLCELF